MDVPPHIFRQSSLSHYAILWLGKKKKRLQFLSSFGERLVFWNLAKEHDSIRKVFQVCEHSTQINACRRVRTCALEPKSHGLRSRCGQQQQKNATRATSCWEICKPALLAQSRCPGARHRPWMPACVKSGSPCRAQQQSCKFNFAFKDDNQSTKITASSIITTTAFIGQSPCQVRGSAKILLKRNLNEILYFPFFKCCFIYVITFFLLNTILIKF